MFGRKRATGFEGLPGVCRHGVMPAEACERCADERLTRGERAARAVEELRGKRLGGFRVFPAKQRGTCGICKYPIVTGQLIVDATGFRVWVHATCKRGQIKG